MSRGSRTGPFGEVPSLSDLEKFFFLDAFDRNVMIARSRQDAHRLGVALQIGTVRYKGLFLEDPLDVPWPVVDYLAEQLGIGIRPRSRGMESGRRRGTSTRG